MNPRSEDSGAEWLLQHASWIRELARSLVGDALRAEDFAQDTMAAALEHPPTIDQPLRPWLATVLRNFVRKAARHRSARREGRSEIEETVTSGLAGPEKICEQFESERLLTEALEELEEPYRRILFLRYYRELPPKAIARHLGLPGGTVRWQLKRGLELLRSRLDARFGDRRAWCVLLIPLARPTETAAAGAAGSSAVLTGALAMNASLKAGAAAATVLVAFLGLAVTGILPDALNPLTSAEPSLPVSFRPLEHGLGPELEPAAPENHVSTPRRSPVGPAGTATVPAGQGEVLPPAVVEAVITDLSGNALSGATLREVSLEGPGTSARCDAGGAVLLELEAGEGGRGVHLEASLGGFASRSEKVRIAPGETVHLGSLELAAGGGVSGRVVDEDGLGLPGVVITAGEAQLDRRRLEQIRFGLHDIGIPACRSDARGDFTLNGLFHGYHRIWGHTPGYLPSWTPPVEVREGQESYGVELVLPRVGDQNRIRGVVIDPHGEPVPFAELEYSHSSETGGLGMSDARPAKADGTFELVLFADTLLSIMASDPDQHYGPASAGQIRAGEQNLVLQLVDSDRIALHVYAADGELVERFRFEVLPVDEEDLPCNLSPAVSAGPGAGYRVPDRPYRVRISAPRHQIETLGPFQPSDRRESLEVHLCSVPGLHGLVYAGDEMVAGTRVTLHRVVPKGERLERNGFRCWQETRELDEDRSDEVGRFLITAREAGEYVVRVVHEGFAAAEFGPFLLGSDLRAEPIELHLGPGGTIEGRILLPRGEDPTGTIVAAHRGDGRARTVRVGLDGAFRFTELIPGPWRVEQRDQDVLRDTTTHSPFSMSSFEAEVQWNCRVVEGQTTRFELLPADAEAYTVKGQLTLDGEPGEEWFAWLGPIDTHFFDNIQQRPISRLDPEGRFELTAGEPGDYWLSVKCLTEGSERVFARQVRLSASETKVALEFQTGTLVVENYSMVPLIEGDDIPSLVYLWSDAEGAVFCCLLVPDENGICTLERVPAGKGRLSRPKVERLLDPLSWEVALAVEIVAGEELRVTSP